MKPVVLITGGTGLVGTALRDELLLQGFAVIILTRNPGQQPGGDSRTAYWNPAKQEIDESAIREADYIINLAGAGVADKRWSKNRKAEILSSRVQSGQLLVKALREIPNKVKAVLQASAIGWYGPDLQVRKETDPGFTETDPPHADFLGNTCKAWEDSIYPVEALGKRLVTFRIGIVLSEKGGALREFLKPLRFRMAAVLGSGKQIVSWIHIADLVNMFITALREEKYRGVYNAVAPAPVSNKELTLTLAHCKKGKAFITMPVPAFVLKVMLGEMSIEVLKSAKVSSQKIREAGYFFKYPDVRSAIEGL